jgi:WD40 repeat protein
MLEYALRAERARHAEEIAELRSSRGEPLGDPPSASAPLVATVVATTPMKQGGAGGGGAGSAGGSAHQTPGSAREGLNRSQASRSRQILRKYLDEMGCTDALISTPLRHNASILSLFDRVGGGADSPVRGGAAAQAPSASLNSTAAVGARAGQQQQQQQQQQQGVVQQQISQQPQPQLQQQQQPPQLAAAGTLGGVGGGGVGGGAHFAAGAQSSTVPASSRSGTSPSRPGSSAPSSEGEDPVDDDLDGASGLVSEDGVNSTLGGAARSSGGSRVWKTKATLRSHFDAIRSVAFPTQESLLLTASEDATAKLWSLSGISGASKKPVVAADIEPVFTFRGHVGPVLSCAIDSDNRRCYTAGVDTRVLGWRLPDPSLDPYAPTAGDTHLAVAMHGHTDAVWSLDFHPFQELLCSASADGTVNLWRPSATSPLVQTLSLGDDHGRTPTSCQFLPVDPRRIVVGYSDGGLRLFDSETSALLLTIAPPAGDGGAALGSITKVSAEPAAGLIATSHVNQSLAIHDPSSGKTVKTLLAHTDCVTAVAFDPSGRRLASAGHDASVRFWDSSMWACVQEVSTHRKKFDEAIHDIAYHPLLTHFATAGADSTAKLLQ